MDSRTFSQGKQVMSPYFQFSLLISFEIATHFLYKSCFKTSSEMIFSLIIWEGYIYKEVCHETMRHTNKFISGLQ